VLTIPETVKLDHIRSSHHHADVETEHGPITVVGLGFRMEHDGGSVERPPAKSARHTGRVLGRGGYSTAEIAENADGEGRLIGPARRRSSSREMAGDRNRQATDLLVVPSEAEDPLIKQQQQEQVPPLRFDSGRDDEVCPGVNPADVQPSK
jgi:hypothetical protein